MISQDVNGGQDSVQGSNRGQNRLDDESMNENNGGARSKRLSRKLHRLLRKTFGLSDDIKQPAITLGANTRIAREKLQPGQPEISSDKAKISMSTTPISTHKRTNFSVNTMNSKLVMNLSSHLDGAPGATACEQHKSPSTTKLYPNTDKPQVDYDVDGGYAWIVLAVIFIINASTFGTARAYGLIFERLARQDDGRGRTEAAMPFTIMGAIENMAGPLSGYLLAQSGNSWRLTVFAGSCLITLAHLLAALANESLPGQLLSMGLMCGLGLSLVSVSFFQLNNAYFERYRSTAFGVGLTGAAFGTLYISPLCQYFLNQHGTRACYLALSAILLPNVPLALLLKPKPIDYQEETHRNSSLTKTPSLKAVEPPTISQQVDDARRRRKKRRSNSIDELGVWLCIKLVITNPLFHLIWPTQLLFCWLNFVFGMIIVDFGRDRGLSAPDLSHLIPCWAFGQLAGRLFLSSLVDFKCLSYKSFTVICFAAISLTTWLLNNIRSSSSSSSSPSSSGDDDQLLLLLMTDDYTLTLIILVLVFVLSMFIALLYILFNGLVVRYVEPVALQPLSIGISSFTGSFFLLPRANIIGYYRDTIGNYDEMLTLFSLVSLIAALTWLLLPPTCFHLRRFYLLKRQQLATRSKARDELRIYSAWKLNTGNGGHHPQLGPTCKHRNLQDQQLPPTHSHKIDLNPNAHHNYEAAA